MFICMFCCSSTKLSAVKDASQRLFSFFVMLILCIYLVIYGSRFQQNSPFVSLGPAYKQFMISLLRLIRNHFVCIESGSRGKACKK